MNNLIPAKLMHLPTRTFEIDGDDIEVCRHIYRSRTGWSLRYKEWEGYFADSMYGSAENAARAAMTDLATLYEGRVIRFRKNEAARKVYKIGVGLYLMYLTNKDYRIIVMSPGEGVAAVRIYPGKSFADTVIKAAKVRDKSRREYRHLVHKKESQVMNDNIRKYSYSEKPTMTRRPSHQNVEHGSYVLH